MLKYDSVDTSSRDLVFRCAVDSRPDVFEIFEFRITGKDLALLNLLGFTQMDNYIAWTRCFTAPIAVTATISVDSAEVGSGYVFKVVVRKNYDTYTREVVCSFEAESLSEALEKALSVSNDEVIKQCNEAQAEMLKLLSSCRGYLDVPKA